ncbi:MAG: GNAT family N-acetyltransferase [Desulfarculaceae bacterium]|nr:GNAT family N-acetyltransferase [Desulfarculaceae bacterium]MCF8072794.1 GNAT family N-acetyltransferase [Desulfarculaceae bacterium]MCF8100962.1 GNAT family N-acetyltransferase [Desulfarculaceae bacterium]
MQATAEIREPWREDVLPGDPALVERLTEASGFFRPDEVAVARELAEERLAKGPASGYHFILAPGEGGLAGYTCYGPIACTTASWDLFWIAVAPGRRGAGLGSALLDLAEQRAVALGGERMYVETSSRPLYRPSRRFYQGRGYSPQAVLPDFYAPGDDKVIYVKTLPRAWSGQEGYDAYRA